MNVAGCSYHFTVDWVPGTCCTQFPPLSALQPLAPGLHLLVQQPPHPPARSINHVRAVSLGRGAARATCASVPGCCAHLSWGHT